ncbi:MAG: hypothetical protein R6U37_01590 [Dehalococcoidia bacterium]
MEYKECVIEHDDKPMRLPATPKNSRVTVMLAAGCGSVQVGDGRRFGFDMNEGIPMELHGDISNLWIQGNAGDHLAVIIHDW